MQHFPIQQSISFKAITDGKHHAVQMHINEVVSVPLKVGAALVLSGGEKFIESIEKGLIQI